MDKWMILTAAVAVTFLGFAWLALAMQDHWEQAFGGSSASRMTQRTLRTMGAAALIVSGILCFAADRPSMAVLVWILLMAFGAVSTAMTLTYKPTLLRFALPRPGSRQ